MQAERVRIILIAVGAALLVAVLVPLVFMGAMMGGMMSIMMGGGGMVWGMGALVVVLLIAGLGLIAAGLSR